MRPHFLSLTTCGLVAMVFGPHAAAWAQARHARAAVARVQHVMPTPPATASPAPGRPSALASPAGSRLPTEILGTGVEATSEIQMLSIKDMTMRQVARLLSQGTGRKVVVSQGAAETPVTAYLEAISVEEALRAVCQAHGLWFRQDRTSDIITIVTLDEYQKGLQAYPQETVEVVTVLYPDVRAIGDALQRLFSNRVIWNPPDEFMNDPIMDVQRALFRMDLLADRAQFSLRDSQGGFGAGRSSGGMGMMGGMGGSMFGGSRFSSGMGGSRFGRLGMGGRQGEEMLIEDVQREMAAEELMARLAHTAAASESPEGEPRVLQPGVVYVSAFRGTNDLMLRSSDPDSIKDVVDVVKRLDKPTPQVLLEVKVLDILLDDEEAYGVDWLFQAGDVSGGQSTGINRTNFGTGFASILPPTQPGLVPQGTGLDPRTAVLQVVTENVLSRIQWLQDRGRLVSLATPNLCVADGEASRVFVGTETTILKSVEVQQSTTGGDNPVVQQTVNPETDRQNLGTTLLITPRIHADRTTTIRLIQEESRLGTTQTIVYGQDEAGSAQSFQSQDVDTRSVTTTVVASDGKICAIGGMIRESTEQRDVGIPGLMDLPVAGAVFRTSFKDRFRNELLVLIRPFVLLAPGEAEPVSQSLMQRLSEHPSAAGDIPPLRIGEGAFMVVNENMYQVPKQAFQAIKCETSVWATEETGCCE
jgi:general secretion pathway protein D